MIRLNVNRYMVENTISETFLNFSDLNRLMGYLIGKKTSHLIIHVIKDEKSRLATVMENDIMDFRKKLQDIMAAL